MLRTVPIGLRSSQIKEANVLDAGGILPGHLVMLDALGNAARQTTAGTVATRVAIENNIFGGGGGWSSSQVKPPQQVIPANPYLSGDQCIYAMLDIGAEVLLIVATGAPAIAVNDPLESAGDGTVRKQLAAGPYSLRAMQAITNTSGSPQQLRAEVII
jgi:hypothetical protein